MDDETRSDPKFRSTSTINNSGSTPYAGAFFPNSQHIVVNGGVFTSHVTNYTSNADLPDDFRRIPLGDIDLRREIRLSSPLGVVHHRPVRGSVRRIYSGRIDGRNSDMTVALYQGQKAEKEWRRDLSRYSGLRHPNFLQIFAIAVSATIRGIIAHDDLIPYYEFVEQYQHSRLLNIYIVGRTETEFWDANQYFEETFQRSFLETRRTDWIRRSTGQLCLDLTPSDLPEMPVIISQRRERSRLDTIVPLDHPNSEAAVIHSLGPHQFHERMYHSIPPTLVAEAELDLGAVIYYPMGSQLEGIEIASMPYADTYALPCVTKVQGEIIRDGWIRYNACDVYDTILDFPVALEEPDSWLCQANHIFHRLQITSNYEDYAPTKDPPPGYLFVSDRQSGPTSFRWPDRRAYWSLDPSGARSLTTAQATRLGFPSIYWARQVYIRSWDDSVYAAVRKFHEAKGFDPDSQDLVRHMDYPLYRISDDIMEVLFAHGETQQLRRFPLPDIETVDAEVPDTEQEHER
ncbi:hypothetical protein C8R44DRAFT_845892 [Mycena epipterygia]|nr:hypothetical protein C8R44DRAFT_845892 [Mycena epipterygia]